MRKTDVEKILQQNWEEAQKLVWKHGNAKDDGDMREIELPNGGVNVVIGIDEGKVTKVRTWEDCGMEYYYEAEEGSKEYVESICDNYRNNDGWTLDCDFAHGTENRIYLAIGKMFGK